MKAALCQMKMLDDMEENLKKAISAMENAAKKGTDLILYPELSLLPFFPQYEKQNVADAAISIGHPLVASFQKACRDNDMYAVPNFYLEENNKRYDASVLIDRNGRIVGVQKMVHIAQAAHFYEQNYYTPSDDGFHIFDTEFGEIGIVVCFDRHYPESIRTEVLKGADFILIPTANTKAEDSEMFEWEIRVQAFQNSVAVAMCNRVGIEGDMNFSGESMVVDAYGKSLVKADDKEQVIYAEVDLLESRKRRNAIPYTNLRRKECYE